MHVLIFQINTLTNQFQKTIGRLEKKEVVLKQLKQMANDSPIAEVNHNVEEIAQRALNECIIEYPNVTDFEKHNSFQMGAMIPFSKIVLEYIPTNNN